MSKPRARCADPTIRARTSVRGTRTSAWWTTNVRRAGAPCASSDATSSDGRVVRENRTRADAIANTRRTTCAPNAMPASVSWNGPSLGDDRPTDGIEDDVDEEHAHDERERQERRVTQDEPQDPGDDGRDDDAESDEEAGPDDARADRARDDDARDDRQSRQRIEPVPGGRTRPADRGRRPDDGFGRLSAAMPSVSARPRPRAAAGLRPGGTARRYAAGAPR